MDLVGPAIDITKCLGAPAYKCLQYHRKLDDYMTNFNKVRDELISKRKDTKQRLEAELRPIGKVPREEVENWLNGVEKMTEKAERVENKFNNGRYLSRACLAKLVEKTIQEMQSFLNKGPCVSESLVIDGPSVGLPRSTSGLIGEKDVRAQIWSYLMQEKVFKVGVWGMGGVGKTTIMNHIHNDLLKEKRFDKVIWVTVSKEFSIMKLQDDIARELKTDLPKEGDTDGRAALLLDRLKNAKKHVLILDDVWDKISLREVGIPEPNRSNGCKLVLTTREEEVCKFLSCQVIKVSPLEEEEALELFLSKVEVEESEIRGSTLRDVVNECAGLPLIIAVVAGILRRQDDHQLWDVVLNDLKCRIEKVEGMEAKVIERLKISFDHLKEKNMQQCFLYCALYPEDLEIREDELIECWIDEGFIAEMDTRQRMKKEGHVILKKLKDKCLLENGIWGVKMHDAVRDMALSITSMNPRYMIKAGMQPKEEEWTADLDKVSLMKNSISEIPIDLSPPKCELLTTLLLQENPIKKISNSFFANMPRLSVLNLSDTEIECLPTSISELKNLTTLLLRGCISLKHLPSLSKLQRLKKLDLSRSGIEEVPEGMERLTNLRYLDLDVKTLKEVRAGVLSKLSRLQHLRFYCYDDKPSIKVEELMPLEKLECFFGVLTDVHELKEFVKSMQCKKNLNAYHLKVGPSNSLLDGKAVTAYPEYYYPVYYPVGLSNSLLDGRAVTICATAYPEYYYPVYYPVGLSNSLLDGRAVTICAQFCGHEILLPIDMQKLEVEGCDSLRSLNDISSLKDAADLRSCTFSACKGIEFVISFSSFSTSCTSFERLEDLSLGNLPGLSEFIKAEGFASGSPILAPPAIFSHLKNICIWKCSNIKKLFHQWLLTNLQNLEYIKVKDCEQLVEIFAVETSEGDDDEEKGSTDNIQFRLPKLRWLSLVSLPELESICSKIGVMDCVSLEPISVIHCSKLKKIPPFDSFGPPTPIENPSACSLI